MSAAFMRGVPHRLSGSCRDLLNCSFIGSDDGAAAVEFGLVAAPFLVLLIAIFETALVFFAGRVLDETTDRAASLLRDEQGVRSVESYDHTLTAEFHGQDEPFFTAMTAFTAGSLETGLGRCSKSRRPGVRSKRAGGCPKSVSGLSHQEQRRLQPKVRMKIWR